jgi:YD repeat-containing protein
VSYENFTANNNNKDGKIQNIVRGGNFIKYRINFYNPAGYLEKEERYKIAGVPEDTALIHISRYFYKDGRVVKIIYNGTYEELNNPDFFDSYVDYIYTNDSVYSRVEADDFLNDSTIRLKGSLNSYTISEKLHTITQGDLAFPFSVTKISFDNSGRKISTIYEQGGKLNSTSTFIYSDIAAIKPEFIQRIDEKSFRKTKNQYWYNKQNDLIAELQFDETSLTNKTSTYEYDYDHHGNWLEKRSLDEHGQLKSLVRRVITYWNE